MNIICTDLEGVWVPEVWINVAQKTGIDELKLTTRDITDYNVLMKRRIAILEREGLTLRDIQNVIAQIEPLPQAREFMDRLRSITQVIVVSDTFVEFADPLMQQLGRPTIFCNSLTVNEKGMITGYNLRQPDPKRKVVEALQSLKYQVVAFGDSYNDISMLKTADAGILYCPPDNVKAEYPQFPVTTNYHELSLLLRQWFTEL